MNKMKQLIPELRFPEFVKEEGWTIAPLSEVYSLKITNSFPRDKLNYDKGIVKNIHYGDIHTKFSTLFDITKETVPYINSDIPIDRIDQDNYCSEGDIVFADASEDLDDVGKSIEIVNLNNEPLLAGLHTFLARQIEPKLIIGFGGYLFKSDSIRTQIKREAQGAKVLGISKGRIYDIKIYYPEHQKEQQKIASCLSSLYELITAHNDKLDTLKDHKKGLMQNLFPQEGKKVPNYRFPEFENDGEWKIKSIDSIAKVSSGGTPTSTEEKYWGGNIPWMNSGELNLKRVKSVTKRITEIGLKESSTKKIPPLCVLIGLAGQGKTRGTAAINYIELCTNQSIAAIHPDIQNFDSEFLYHKIDSMYKTLRRLSTGQGGRGGLNLSIIKEIEILFPSIQEQQKIASCLSVADELITAQKEKIKQLEQHKKGLMQGLFPKFKNK